MFLSIFSLAALFAAPAQATWSIVAVDPDTRQVGVAGATCGPMVWQIGQVAPGEGAIAAQYATKLSLRRDGADALADGATPAKVLKDLTDDEVDAKVSIRQYGVAAFSGPAQAFTGAEVEHWKGSVSDEVVTVQGNTLRGEDVVQAAYDAYVDGGDVAFDERLLLALEAGAEQGGDKRCDADVAAKSAFLFVAASGDDRPTIDLTASDKHGAVAALRDKYEDGRRQNWHCASVSGVASAPAALLLGLVAVARRRDP